MASEQKIDKFFLKSKTIIGAILGLLAVFGITIPVANEEVAIFLELLQELVAFVLVIWGRFTASSNLSYKIK